MPRESHKKLVCHPLIKFFEKDKEKQLCIYSVFPVGTVFQDCKIVDALP